MLPLIGVAIVVAGFLLRFNPLVTVLAAAGASGLAAGLSPVRVVEAFGHAFNENRYVSAVWLVLPLIGLLERYGLQERARALVGGARRATAGRLLMLYFVFRQATAAIGLTSVGGHAQMVRPLVAPMAEGAAEAGDPRLSEPLRRLVRAYAAATDNIGVFFGEDIFIAHVLDPTDPRRAAGRGCERGAAAAIGLGDSDRRRRAGHPRGADVAA